MADSWEQPRLVEVLEGRAGERALKRTYEMFEVIGVGSTSTVHRCRHRQTGVEYACKIIDMLHVETKFQGMINQFRTEIHALRALHHPHIIKLYNVYITDNKIYIIMELMEGGEVYDYIVERGSISEEEASDIVRKVTSALAYTHAKNIIHRDLKPENLLLKHKPQGPGDLDVKIIDFGLSKRMDEPAARGFLGTKGYLAPEMLQRKEYSYSIDAWALGVVVFVLLCGRLPFHDVDDDNDNDKEDDEHSEENIPSDAAIQSKYSLKEFPPWAKDISAPAKDLLIRLLDVDPNTRYTAEQAMLHPWVTGNPPPEGFVFLTSAPDTLIKEDNKEATTAQQKKETPEGGEGEKTTTTTTVNALGLDTSNKRVDEEKSKESVQRRGSKSKKKGTCTIS